MLALIFRKSNRVNKSKEATGDQTRDRYKQVAGNRPYAVAAWQHNLSGKDSESHIFTGTEETTLENPKR